MIRSSYGTCDESSRGDRMAHTADQARDTRDQAEQSERANAGDPRPFAHAPEIEASLDSDQQAARNRGAERKRLTIKIAVQRSRSACQRRWSAIKVEMK